VLIAVVGEQAGGEEERHRLVEVQAHRGEVRVALDAIAPLILPDRHPHVVQRVEVAVDRPPVDPAVIG
jgi:hypothetical protein